LLISTILIFDIGTGSMLWYVLLFILLNLDFIDFGHREYKSMTKSVWCFIFSFKFCIRLAFTIIRPYIDTVYKLKRRTIHKNIM